VSGLETEVRRSYGNKRRRGARGDHPLVNLYIEEAASIAVSHL
jgi:hypothetical protein